MIGVFVVFVLLASLVSGLTGFGFGLVLVPLLTIFLPPKVVIPLVQMLVTVPHLMVLVETRKWVDLKRLWPLLLTGLASVSLGTYLLLLLEEQTLRMLVGLVVVVSALTLLAGWQRPAQREKLALFPVGVASGVLSGSTGMGGPPVILFLANQGVEKQVFRANLILYFTCLSVVTAASAGLEGLVTREVVTYWAVLLPAAVLGALIGMRLARRVDQHLFRQITLVVLILMGASAIASGLGLFA